MKILAGISVLIVAALHVAFLVLEMFFWTDPIGQQVFSTTPEFAAASAVLAANQGLYNGFLAAGLLWGLVRKNQEFVLFFLVCVMAAGIYGSLTASSTILIVQAIPALIAFLINLFQTED